MTNVQWRYWNSYEAFGVTPYLWTIPLGIVTTISLTVRKEINLKAPYWSCFAPICPLCLNLSSSSSRCLSMSSTYKKKIRSEKNFTKGSIETGIVAPTPGEEISSQWGRVGSETLACHHNHKKSQDLKELLTVRFFSVTR